MVARLQRCCKPSPEQECGFIDGETPTLFRASAIDRFREGELKYLCNMNVLTTGFDAPNIDCIALLRPTLSPGLFCQMIGRGLRLASGKTDCLVLDFAGNVMRHGPIDQIRVPDPKRSAMSYVPIKECPECHSLIATGYTKCPDCGYEYPHQEPATIDSRDPKHEESASEEGLISGQTSETVYEVRDVFYHIHTKKGADESVPKSMRVDYKIGFHRYKSEWICFEHVGFARRRAEEWWQARSDHAIPATAEEAVALANAGALSFAKSINDLLMMEQYFKKIPTGRYKIIILDAFYRFMPKNMDENDNGTMTTIYNRLDDYAEKLRTAFVLIHHTSKGNQSAKSITDVGAGAGSQSRATDTHLVLRMHDQPDVAVLDAAVRSWPPPAPRCLRWAYPVWMPADDLDPNRLRQEGKQRKASPPTNETFEPDEPAIETAEQFVEEFVGAEPQLRELIIEDAEEAGISNARAKQFLKRALARGLIYRWEMEGNQYGYSTEIPRASVDNANEGDNDEANDEGTSKREAVEMAIRRNFNLSSREIAEMFGVTKQYVNRIRKEMG